MRILSVTQPWASLIAIGAKTIETRSWATSHRGPIGIHASAGFPGVCKTLCGQSPFWEVLTRAHMPGTAVCPVEEVTKRLPLGSILAVGRLDRIETTFLLSQSYFLTEQERAFGDYSGGRYGWMLEGVKVLPEPIPAKGVRGLWRPQPAVLEVLERFYRDA